jgi:predicted transposase YbfD/YdcC
MGQIKTEEKSNEITAIPALLSSLDITGGVVSSDAIGCQKAIASMIIARDAQYLLSVKANQPTLLEEIREYFTWAQTDPIERKFLDLHVSEDFSHGRHTKWRACVCDAGWFEDKRDWPALHTFIRVERISTRNGHTSTESAYFISSLLADAPTFSRLIRNHWSIENQLHWALDVSFHEDACRVREANSVQNLSLLRKFALAIIKADSSCKASVARKRKKAAVDDTFALSLLAAS